MSECRVVCEECRSDEGARVWRWLCEDCAQDCRDRHRRDTGHTTELVVVPDSADALAEGVARAARLMGGRW